MTTTKASYPCRAVLLTIGRRGTPRQLGVPGEEQTKVVYRLIDPAEYEGQHVLVVGGGDSALEAAHSIAETPGTTVTLSYRSAAFSRAKAANRNKVEELAAAGRLRVLMESNVKEMRSDDVAIEYQGKAYKLAKPGHHRLCRRYSADRVSQKYRGRSRNQVRHFLNQFVLIRSAVQAP